MYNHTVITDCLQGLVGFESSYYSEHPTVDEDLRSSASGVYIGPGMHPLLTYENILAVAEHFSQINVRVYVPDVMYKKGEIVKAGADIYQAEKDTELSPLDTSWWVKTNLYSAFLRRVYSNSIAKLIGAMFTEKKMNEAAKTLLSDVALFAGVGNINNRITKENRVVGFKITIRNSDTAAILSHIGIQVDQVQNDVKVYLYHSSSNVPVKIWTFNQTKAVQFQWQKLPAAEILSYMDDNIYPGGSWYICYYENQWTGDAIRKDISFSGNYACGTCSEVIVNRNMYGKWSPFVGIQPFYVNSASIDSVTFKLWDETKEILVEDYNWGLNLQMSIQCDVSSWICKNSTVLTDALAKQITVDLLNEMAYSLRDNHKKEKIAGLAAVALDNQENGMEGEAKKLRNAIKALSFDFSGMNSVCLPCNNEGYQLKSVWSR